MAYGLAALNECKASIDKAIQAATKIRDATGRKPTAGHWNVYVSYYPAALPQWGALSSLKRRMFITDSLILVFERAG